MKASNRCLLFLLVKLRGAKREKKQSTVSLLRGANDWTCDFDLPECRSAGSAYVFPHDVCVTQSKIDGYIISRERRFCIGIELTCPMEENFEKWHVIKKEKYENEISHEAAKNGWRFDKLIMEVGARGFVPRNVSKALSQLEPPAVIAFVSGSKVCVCHLDQQA